ncbi:hypothetical protein ACHAXR_002405, partial [Thalassiosira sp. AJA248-18]
MKLTTLLSILAILAALAVLAATPASTRREGLRGGHGLLFKVRDNAHGDSVKSNSKAVAIAFAADPVVAIADSLAEPADSPADPAYVDVDVIAGTNAIPTDQADAFTPPVIDQAEVIAIAEKSNDDNPAAVADANISASRSLLHLELFKEASGRDYDSKAVAIAFAADPAVAIADSLAEPADSPADPAYVDVDAIEDDAGAHLIAIEEANPNDEDGGSISTILAASPVSARRGWIRGRRADTQSTALSAIISKDDAIDGADTQSTALSAIISKDVAMDGADTESIALPSIISKAVAIYQIHANATGQKSNRDLQTNTNGCSNAADKTPDEQWHPTYAAGWMNGYCRKTIDCNSPGYPSELACCKGAYAGQTSGFCVLQLPNPPTTSPTDEGGVDVYYPDYNTRYADAYCRNDRPMPNGRPTFATMLACCKGAYPDQRSGECSHCRCCSHVKAITCRQNLNCFNIPMLFLSRYPGVCLSMLPISPAGSLHFWYPVYENDYAEGVCSNKLPLP